MKYPEHNYGEYGGRVLRSFKADVPYIEGAEITAEAAMKWPLGNRRALHELHKVEWYGPPEDAKKRTVAADEAVKTKAPVIPKEEKKVTEPKTPAVKKSSRTK
jgi:hypothetical protein